MNTGFTQSLFTHNLNVNSNIRSALEKNVIAAKPPTV